MGAAEFLSRNANDDLIIMSKDVMVMRVNTSEGRYEILNEMLLPYPLKGKIRKVLDFSEVKTRYDDTQRTIAMGRTINL